jgi:hypothetical protein
VEQTSGVREFADILDELRTRESPHRGPHVWAQEGMCLYTTGSRAVELHAISPSAQTITNTQRAIGQLVPSIGAPIGRIPVVHPNEASVAIILKSRSMHFLLGGDLEHVSDDHCGWKGVLRSTRLPVAIASAYKVAHHGADNADCEGIWADLLVPRPHAALTPYAAGRKARPTEEDVRRIKAKARSLYSTVQSLRFKPPRRRGVDQTIEDVAKDRQAVRKVPGHVRIRAPLTGNVQDVAVAVFEGAGLL